MVATSDKRDDIMNVNQMFARKACYNLGFVEPINIETDGTVWLGNDPNNPDYLSNKDQSKVLAETAVLEKAYLDAHPVE